MTALFRLYKETQDITLRDNLVCRHLHLVHSVARRFSGLGESLDDLIQEGTIGLLKAVDTFDAERGVKFSTYSCHLITSQIQHYLRDRGRIIRQPAWVQELNTKVTRASEQLTQELGRDPQLAEIADRLKLNESTINQVLAARELNCDSDMSLGDKEKTLANKLAALQLPVEDQIVLKEAIASLKTLEQDVVRLFFYEDLNLSEIARKLNISVNYSSYLLRRSITKIRAILDEQQSLETAVLADPPETEPASLTADLPTYDRFTGLYTGVYLRARLAEEIARSRRYPTNFALMVIDIGRPDPASKYASYRLECLFRARSIRLDASTHRARSAHPRTTPR
jgi:RNA polymerase sigma-B factor